MTPADEVVAKLDALLAATPAPPDDPEPEAVLSAFAAIEQARAALLVELAVLASTARGDPRVARSQADLSARDQAWLGALARAQIVVDQRLGATRRVRTQR